MKIVASVVIPHKYESSTFHSYLRFSEYSNFLDLCVAQLDYESGMQYPQLSDYLSVN